MFTPARTLTSYCVWHLLVASSAAHAGCKIRCRLVLCIALWLPIYLVVNTREVERGGLIWILGRELIISKIHEVT
ncbi:hypothetical protein BGZ63DRAFT_109777 [Mariannaea sp. PMI_226]|nr:hypothetical protein BGZ63DRAFT_109777 [Mariannaea sp. PMI_226]